MPEIYIKAYKGEKYDRRETDHSRGSHEKDKDWTEIDFL